jgi:hypothetical protein
MLYAEPLMLGLWCMSVYVLTFCVWLIVQLLIQYIARVSDLLVRHFDDKQRKLGHYFYWRSIWTVI